MKKKDELIKIAIIVGCPLVAGIIRAFDPKAVVLTSPLGGPFWLFSILLGLAFGVCGYLLYKVCESFVKKKLLRKKT